ncbi:MAG: hypothetical protein ACLGG0_02200 [Bacteriovoracia bacterium]
MKYLAFILAMSSVSALAQPLTKVVYERHDTVDIVVSEDTVRCVRRFEGDQLKIKVPLARFNGELNHIHVFDNEVNLQAGTCTADFNENTVLAGQNGAQNVPLKVQRIHEVWVDETRDVCDFLLVEELSTVINGVPFNSIQKVLIPGLSAKACLEIVK